MNISPLSIGIDVDLRSILLILRGLVCSSSWLLGFVCVDWRFVFGVHVLYNRVLVHFTLTSGGSFAMRRCGVGGIGAMFASQ